MNDARQIPPRPTRVGMATKFGEKSAITRLVQEISVRCLHLAGGFRGQAIEWCQPNSTAANPCCHGNEIWEKIGHNLACIRDNPRCLRITEGFLGWAIEWRQTSSTTTNPRCHGNKIWDKIGYNSTCMRNISEMFASNRGFSGSGYWLTPDKF